mmetsp:Transcript_25827/g.68353  ORF Transcript_25827/g.68353 Transcript_25827/m.68353 type:complete len:409 (+) Transcript_25827:91-1317(+)
MYPRHPNWRSKQGLRQGAAGCLHLRLRRVRAVEKRPLHRLEEGQLQIDRRAGHLRVWRGLRRAQGVLGASALRVVCVPVDGDRLRRFPQDVDRLRALGHLGLQLLDPLHQFPARPRLGRGPRELPEGAAPGRLRAARALLRARGAVQQQLVAVQRRGQRLCGPDVGQDLLHGGVRVRGFIRGSGNSHGKRQPAVGVAQWRLAASRMRPRGVVRPRVEARARDPPRRVQRPAAAAVVVLLGGLEDLEDGLRALGTVYGRLGALQLRPRGRPLLLHRLPPLGVAERLEFPQRDRWCSRDMMVDGLLLLRDSLPLAVAELLELQPRGVLAENLLLALASPAPGARVAARSGAPVFVLGPQQLLGGGGRGGGAVRAVLSRHPAPAGHGGAGRGAGGTGGGAPRRVAWVGSAC